MVFAMGMLIGASLGCTFGFVLSGILRSSKLADITETKVERPTPAVDHILSGAARRAHIP